MPISAAGGETPDPDEMRLVVQARARTGSVTAMAEEGVMPPLPLVFLDVHSHPLGTDLVSVYRDEQQQPEPDRFKFALTLVGAQMMAAQLSEAVRRSQDA